MRKKSSRTPRPCGIPTIFGMTKAMVNDLQIIPLGILEAFREGTGTEQGWSTLAAAVNVAAVLSRKQPREVQLHIEDGMEALLAIQKRGSERGMWGCSGDEYKAIRLALILGADMQDSKVSTRKEVGQAIVTVLREATT